MLFFWIIVVALVAGIVEAIIRDVYRDQDECVYRSLSMRSVYRNDKHACVRKIKDMLKEQNMNWELEQLCVLHDLRIEKQSRRDAKGWLSTLVTAAITNVAASRKFMQWRESKRMMMQDAEYLLATTHQGSVEHEGSSPFGVYAFSQRRSRHGWKKGMHVRKMNAKAVRASNWNKKAARSMARSMKASVWAWVEQDMDMRIADAQVEAQWAQMEAITL